MSKKALLPLVIILSATLFFSFVENTEGPKEIYAKTISAKDLKTHLSVIASDKYEGRETGKKGQHMTAEYLSNQFRQFGIPELATGGYYQNVPLIQLTAGEGTVKTSTQSFLFGKDFYYTNSNENQQLKFTDIVFSGYGIQDSLFRDYDKSDLGGKAVMIIADEPIDKNGKSLISRTKENSIWTTSRGKKTSEAKKHNAGALLIAVADFQKHYEQVKKYITSPSLRLDNPNKMKGEQEMPVIYISFEMANSILKEGKQKTTIEKAISKTLKKNSAPHFTFSQQLDLSITIKTEKINSENVLGYLEGSDLKNELVVVTAHMDHLGKTGDVVYNGADDDGSGTVSVLEIAEAFSIAKKDGHGPRRSILFMLVTGEEKGLLGSKWYTDNPVFPLGSTVCDLNIDMIGRIDPAHKSDSNYVYVIGSDKISTELKKINEENNKKYIGLLLDYRYDVPNEPNNFYGRSDHYNFAKNNIPIAFFFNGVHSDYHKETDEVSKINFSLMEKRARLVYYDCWDIANRDQRLPLDVKTSK
ncbi:hypothetical protein BH09BAC5_BH09BAC5_08570 [soil metagenome]